MRFSFTYEKKKVIQALRDHFIQKMDVRIMIVLVNVFALLSAVLYAMKKIRPEPFFLGTVIWMAILVTFWFILPATIYRKSATFRDSFTIDFLGDEVRLQNQRGYVQWPWPRFSRWFESPHFFHLYFDPKSFFIVPKDGLSEEQRHELRGLLKQKIGN